MELMYRGERLLTLESEFVILRWIRTRLASSKLDQSDSPQEYRSSRKSEAEFELFAKMMNSSFTGDTRTPHEQLMFSHLPHIRQSGRSLPLFISPEVWCSYDAWEAEMPLFESFPNGGLIRVLNLEQKSDFRDDP